MILSCRRRFSGGRNILVYRRGDALRSDTLRLKTHRILSLPCRTHLPSRACVRKPRLTTTQNQIRSEIAALGPWVHNLSIRRIDPAPDHFLGDYPRQKCEGFRDVLQDDLEGRSLMDIGCNAGFFAVEMKRHGPGAEHRQCPALPAAGSLCHRRRRSGCRRAPDVGLRHLQPARTLRPRAVHGGLLSSAPSAAGARCDP